MDKYTQMSMLDSIDGVKPLNNTKYTYKSHNLIFSSYELSLTQQRIISLGCKKIQPIYIEKRLSPNDLKKVLGAMHFSLIDISVSEYKHEYNIKGNNIYDSLEKETNDLYEAGFFYFDESKKLKKRRWISSIDFDRPNGQISLTFNPDILLDLLVFKSKFVALLFDLSQNIKSKYAFRIYEILKSVSYLGEYTFSVEEFKFLLDITDKYEDFSNLNKKVIKPNLEIIKKFSDIEAKMTTIRQGKQGVKYLKFNITKKKNTKIIPDDDFAEKIPTAFEEISKELSKYDIKLTSTLAQTLFNESITATKEKYPDMNPVEYIINKIKILDSYVETHDTSSAVGFLIDSIKKDYQIQTVNKRKTNNFVDCCSSRNYSDEYINELENKLVYNG